MSTLTYFQTRSRMLKASGRCTRCGSMPLAAWNRSMCAYCLRRMKLAARARRVERARRGVCRNHGDRPAVAGRRSCQACLDADLAYKQVRWRALDAAGKCRDHPAVAAVEGKTRCVACIMSGR